MGIKMFLKYLERKAKEYKPKNFYVSSEGKLYAIAEEVLALKHVREDLKIWEKLK